MYLLRLLINIFINSDTAILSFTFLSSFCWWPLSSHGCKYCLHVTDSHVCAYIPGAEFQIHIHNWLIVISIWTSPTLNLECAKLSSCSFTPQGQLYSLSSPPQLRTTQSFLFRWKRVNTTFDSLGKQWLAVGLQSVYPCNPSWKERNDPTDFYKSVSDNLSRYVSMRAVLKVSSHILWKIEIFRKM